MKSIKNLSSLLLVLFLIACQPDKIEVKTGWYPPSFAWHKETKEWLKAAEQTTPPPVQAVLDFNELDKREKAIEANRQ